MQRKTRAMPEPEFYDARQAAVFLGVSERQVWTWIKDPADPLPVFRLSRRATRMRRADLISWAERRRDDRGNRINRLVDEMLK